MSQNGEGLQRTASDASGSLDWPKVECFKLKIWDSNVQTLGLFCQFAIDVQGITGNDVCISHVQHVVLTGHNFVGDRTFRTTHIQPVGMGLDRCQLWWAIFRFTGGDLRQMAWF